MAKGYLVGTITVTDPDAYKPYMENTSRLVAKYGGRYLIRGGDMTVAEGQIDHDRVVVIEFGSMEALQNFYNDPEYAEVKKIRQANSRGVIMKVTGVESD
ncbi:DUF1330 domain-containing protein [Alphaproteobacteria bacterium LSUCC0684]